MSNRQNSRPISADLTPPLKLRRGRFRNDRPGDQPVDVLQMIQGEASTNRAIKNVRDLYGLKHLTFLVARYGTEPEKDPYVRSTYPATWMAQYLLKRYWSIDPVMRQGFSRVRPFDWDEIDRSDPRVADFFSDAARHQIGQSGYLLPLRNKQGQRAILSINSDLVADEWTSYKRTYLPDLLEIGTALHRRGVKEVFGDEELPPRLSPRETESLRWVAEGKEVPDIAIITGLSEHTVRTYLKTARMKLNCGTMAQAAVRAERYGLLGEDARGNG